MADFKVGDLAVIKTSVMNVLSYKGHTLCRITTVRPTKDGSVWPYILRTQSGEMAFAPRELRKPNKRDLAKYTPLELLFL